MKIDCTKDTSSDSALASARTVSPSASYSVLQGERELRDYVGAWSTVYVWIILFLLKNVTCEMLA